MTPAAPAPPRDPVAATPPLAPGTFRRTSHVDVGPGDGERWMQAQPVGLWFRGEVVDRGPGPTRRAAASLVHAEVDAHRVLRAIRSGAQDVGRLHGRCDALIGERVGPGFRRVVESIDASPIDDLFGVLLFDLPTAALIAGYAEIRSRTLAGVAPGEIVGPAVLPYVEEVCAGWASDGLMVTSIRRGEGVPIQDCPAAPLLDEGWHDVGPLPVGWLRRRRRVDVGPDGAVDAMFRDSYAEPDGRETVLHEYAVAGGVEVDGTIGALAATPRVLPFAECPLAADNVVRLLGTPGRDLRPAVRDHLAATAGCTHLNDLLAAIGDVLAARGA